VTGASRGLGKGIALGLGAAGATVYVTGRTVADRPGARPGTIHETAEDIGLLGGEGIALPCDHGDDDEVAALFRRVGAEQGRLDVLVNNATAFPDPFPPQGTLWELPVELLDQCLRVGLRSHYVASAHAVPIMIRQASGLIVHVSSRGAVDYLFNVAYGIGKAGVDKLAADLAHELRPYGIASISVWPPLTNRDQDVVAELGLRAPTRSPREGLPGAFSPLLTGRAVAALAADPGAMDKSGTALTVASLAKEYGFADIDGAVPPRPV
jgi:dehydrogenase/reductase SDR family protein 1